MALFSVGSHSPTSSSAVSMCLLLRQWGFAASLLWHRKDPGICQQHHVSEPDVTQIQDLPVGVAHEQDAIQEWICLGSGAIHHWAMKNTNLWRDCCLLVPTKHQVLTLPSCCLRYFCLKLWVLFSSEDPVQGLVPRQKSQQNLERQYHPPGSFKNSTLY